MSVKLMGVVWDAELDRNLKLVLLAMADHADHDGNNVYPSIGLLAWKTGYDERYIRKTIRELESAGILKRRSDGKGGKGRATNYSIVPEAIPMRPPYRAKPGHNDPVSEPGHNDPLPDKPGHLEHSNPVIMTPEPSIGTVNNPTGISSSANAERDIPYGEPAAQDATDLSDHATAETDHLGTPDTGVPADTPARAPAPVREANAPYARYAAMMEGLGRDPGELSGEVLQDQIGKLNRSKIVKGLTSDEVRTLAAYLNAQPWRTQPVTAKTIASEAGEWVAAGKPEPQVPETKKPSNITRFRNREDQQIEGQARAEAIYRERLLREGVIIDELPY